MYIIIYNVKLEAVNSVVIISLSLSIFVDFKLGI